jgi:hypothetical protein
MKVGDRLKIINMAGEPHYTGREGIITRISKDPYGEVSVDGTWGGLSVYPSQDTVVIIPKEEN